jgi:hypothetical protein
MSARRLWRITDGERSLVLALASMAMLGATFGLIVSVRLGSGQILSLGLQAYDLWIILSGALGNAFALWLMRHRMGQPGLAGLAQALLGIMGITFLGPVIAGSLMLPFYGTMFGPFTMFIILAGAPAMAFVWLATLALVHYLMRPWFDERNSIFVPLPRAA